jgi:F-type H+-transporting ATPase subunit b
MTASSIYLAFAQAGAKAPEASAQQLLDVDGTLFINLGLFLVAMFLLTQLFWKPYLRVRAERTSRIEGEKENARTLEAEAATRLSRVDAELAEARRAGSAERARVRNEAQRREQEVLSRAQTAAQKTLAEGRARIESAMTTERASLAARAEALGREAAEKVLGRRVVS